FLLLVAVLTIFSNLPETPLTPTKKIYTVARDASWAPFSFAGKETELAAFSDALLTAIANDQNFILHVQPTSPANLFIGLNNQEYDGVLSARVPEGSILKKYYFSPIYFPFGPVIIAKAHSDINAMGDLKGKLVGLTASPELENFPTGSDTTYISYPSI